MKTPIRPHPQMKLSVTQVGAERAPVILIYNFLARFNRALIYRGISLHAGDIDADFPFDPDPRTGRLTANTVFVFGQPMPSLVARSSPAR